MRAALVLSIVALGCSSAGAHETGGDARTTDSAASASSNAASAASTSSNAAATTSATADAPPGATWAQRLSPLVLRDVNTLNDVMLRLYKDDGTLDEAAANEVDRVLWIAKDEPPSPRPGAPPRAPTPATATPPPEPVHVNRRLLQLLVKAAAHFGVHEVQVISSHRSKARPGSRHRSGEAIDFALPGVPAKKLAEELRTYARVGVGVYVHPRAQFVHLDVREQSYHWIDGSPPGRTWREQALPDVTAAARDAAYSPSQDLPDSAQAP